MPNAGLQKAIEKQFTSVDSLKKLMNVAAATRLDQVGLGLLLPLIINWLFVLRQTKIIL